MIQPASAGEDVHDPRLFGVTPDRVNRSIGAAAFQPGSVEKPPRNWM